MRFLFRALGFCTPTGCSSHSWDLASCCGCGRTVVELCMLPSGEPSCRPCYASNTLVDPRIVWFPEPLTVTWAELDRRLAEEVGDW